MPWAAIIGAVGSILGSLIMSGGSNNTPATQTTTTPAKSYQSPMLGLYDLLGGQLALGRYNSLAGAGMPGGQGFTGNSSDALSMLSKLIPELSGAMMNGGLAQTNPNVTMSNAKWIDSAGQLH